MRITMYCNKCLRYEKFLDSACGVCGSKYTPTVRKEVEVKQKGVTQKKKPKEVHVQTDLLGFDALKKG